MGAGGMGGYIGGRLAQAGNQVSFVARGRQLEALRRSGLQVRSHRGNIAIDPVSVTDDPAQIGPVELLLFCVKAYDLTSAAALAKPLVGPDTAIIPVQNGIEHIDHLTDVFGADHLLGGEAYISAVIAAPGIIQHNRGPDTLEFGELDGSNSERCRVLLRTLSVPGFEVRAQPDILSRMWWKFAAHCGVSLFCVVRATKGAIWASPETRALYQRAIGEALAVARAKGIPLADGLLDEVDALMRSLPEEWKPSMLVAAERGERLEAEICGSLSRLGRELGVATPVNDFIYACLKPNAGGTPRRER